MVCVVLVFCLEDFTYAQVIKNIKKASLKYENNDLVVKGNLEEVELFTGSKVTIDSTVLLENTSIRCKKLLFTTAKQIVIKGTVSITSKDIEFLNDIDLKFEGVGAKLFITYSKCLQSNHRVVKVEISDHMKFSCEKK